MGQTASAPTPAPVAPQKPAQCPVDHSAMSLHQKPASSTPAECPVSHSPSANPRNNMPELPQHAISALQSQNLSTDRISSSIPRDESTTWDYPSPQQFYNALVRKGWETPEEHVSTMVEIHNFLNEEAWNEVLKWEKRVQGYVHSTRRNIPCLYSFCVGLLDCSWRVSRDGQGNIHQKHASSCLLGDYSLRDSGV